MSTPALRKIPAIEPCQSRYVVVMDGEDIGLLSKYDDSWITKFKWKAWCGKRVVRYLGEFDTCDEAVKALVDSTKG